MRDANTNEIELLKVGTAEDTWTINQILHEVSFEEHYRFYEEQHLEKDKESAAEYAQKRWLGWRRS